MSTAWSFAPGHTWEAYNVLPDPLVGFKGVQLRARRDMDELNEVGRKV